MPVKELLGLDPLYLACEGRFVAVIDTRDNDKAVALLTAADQTQGARVIGQIAEGTRGQVILRTPFGRRLLRYLNYDQQPRIC